MKANRLLVSILLVIALVQNAVADEIFVRNRPFKGPAEGLGEDMRFSLPHLAEALGLKAEQGEEGWSLDGRPIATHAETGVTWVKLRDLPKSLVRIDRNADLRTLDIRLALGTQEVIPEHEWMGENTLVYFGATWCPACKAMSGSIDQLRRSRRMKIVFVDIDRPDDPAFKEHAEKQFRGSKIPYFVVLDKKKKRKHDFAGFRTYKALLKELKPYY